MVQLFSFVLLVSHLCLTLGLMHSPRSPVHAKSQLNMAFDFFSPGGSSALKSSSGPGNKPVCVITGTSSGLGKETAKALLKKGEYYVVCGCRDVEKMKQIADEEGFDPKDYTILELELGSFNSVKKFATKLKTIKKRPLERLVCNAAVYQPALPTVSYTRASLFYRDLATLI